LNVSDVAVNVLGFVPFGGLLVIYLKNSRAWSNRKAIILAILLGFVVSLVIEVLQVFLPTRDSSLLDLINNTLGTGIGGAVGVAVWPQLQSLRRSISVSVRAERIGWGREQ
jgi:VanZ family protein